MQCRKRLGSNDIRLTQEFFGQMLGVQRTTINLVERTLQNAGLIQIGRGPHLHPRRQGAGGCLMRLL
jgi:hypothetical protein